MAGMVPLGKMPFVKTFSISTLGCRVNHYESEQLATLLRARGLMRATAGQADLRIIHTCSVTVQAASKSRQTVRRMVRLPVMGPAGTIIGEEAGCESVACAGECASDCGGATNPGAAPGDFTQFRATSSSISAFPLSNPESGGAGALSSPSRRPRVVVTGCWATSDAEQAKGLGGVDAVLGHHQDVGGELSRLLTQWEEDDRSNRLANPTSLDNENDARDGSENPRQPNEEWMIETADGRENQIALYTSTTRPLNGVKGKLEIDEKHPSAVHNADEKAGKSAGKGMVSLPMLGKRQTGHQRAFLKVQDGCDAHCTYCIIPQLRPALWSKPVEEAVEEARRLVEAGHVEIVLTGIFLGAYGMGTALRRRQGATAGPLDNETMRQWDNEKWEGEGRVAVENAGPLGELVDALCTRVEGLRRVRLSSIEPGDLSDELVAVMRRHKQIVPHFHVPLQSGSDRLLRKMNRQYGRVDFLEMVARLKEAFDRPALTTDIIVGFPGETDEEFERTVEVVEQAGFLHIHAFSYSPRPGTAAARWTRQWVRGPVVNERIDRLGKMASDYSMEFRRQFIGAEVELLVENPSGEESAGTMEGFQHGRCERYFPVWIGEAEKLEVRSEKREEEGVNPMGETIFPASGQAGTERRERSDQSAVPDGAAGRMRQPALSRFVPGDAVRARIDRVEGERTFGTVLEVVR